MTFEKVLARVQLIELISEAEVTVRKGKKLKDCQQEFVERLLERERLKVERESEDYEIDPAFCQSLHEFSRSIKTYA